MGLFKKNKKVSHNFSRKRKESLPEFPKYESSLQEGTDLPKYEPHGDLPNFKLPEPKLPPALAMDHDFEVPKRIPSKIELVNTENEFNPRTLDQFSTMPERRGTVPSTPIFVKLADYKKSLENLRDVKEMIAEAEELISEIQSLRIEEDKQLSNWQHEISDIKSKLMEVDKDLFEYK